MLFKTEVVVLALVFIAGCAGKHTPNCSDDRTLGLVKEIIAESISKDSETIKSLIPQISLDLVVTNQHDDKIDKYTCGAQMNFILPPSLKEGAQKIQQFDFKKAQGALELGNFFSPLGNPQLQEVAEKLQELSKIQVGLKDSQFDGQALSQPIEFTSQTADNGEAVVAVKIGATPIIGLLRDLVSLRPKDKAPSERLAAGDQTPQEAPPPSQQGNNPKDTSLENTDVIRTSAAVVTIAKIDPNSHFGKRLEINGQKAIDGNGDPVEDDFLTFVQHFQLPNNDVIILTENCSGSACGEIGSYRILVLPAKGSPTISASFGDPQTEPKISTQGGKIILDFGQKGVALFENGIIQIPKELM